MYKIAIFSDIHSNLEVLEAIINDINKNNFNEVICLGDVIAIGPNPRECLDLIISNNVHLVLGNHDLYYVYGPDIDVDMTNEEKTHQRWVASNLTDTHREYLKKCSLTYSINVNNYNIGFEHFLIDKSSTDGYPFQSLKILKDSKIKEILTDEPYDILFLGHGHEPFEIDASNKRFIGVGSSGCRKDNKTYYTILTISDNKYTIEKKELIYDRSKFEEKMKQDYPLKKFLSKTFFGIE